MSSVFKQYYLLTKPGIIRGNALAAVGGFLLAAQGDIDWSLLAAAVFGTSFVIASACVFNNYLDRGIDQKMARTQSRALVTGVIPVQHALIYATLLGVIGFTLLAFTNLATVVLGLLGIFFYVVVYGIWKRKSVYGTLVGSISGSVPPVAGYTAVTGEVDAIAVLLFLILTFWQMPHFYAIAIYRLKDYKNASIPVLPAVKGLRRTKIEITTYIAAYTLAVMLLGILGYLGSSYLIVVSLISLYWLYIAIRGMKDADEIKWAHKIFGFSLINLLVFCLMISIDAYLP